MSMNGGPMGEWAWKEHLARRQEEDAALAAAEDELAMKWSRGVGVGVEDVMYLTYGGSKLDDQVKEMKRNCIQPMVTYTPPEKIDAPRPAESKSNAPPTSNITTSTGSSKS